MLHDKNYDIFVNEAALDRPAAKEEMLGGVNVADALLSTLTDKIDAEIMDAGLPTLKIIANFAVGFDNVDLEAAKQRNILVSNGISVKKGADILDYLTDHRIRLTVEIPVTQTNFEHIHHFKINGRQVQRIIKVDWRLNPQQTGAIAAFIVEPGFSVSGTVHIDAQMDFPGTQKQGLDGIEQALIAQGAHGDGFWGD